MKTWTVAAIVMLLAIWVALWDSMSAHAQPVAAWTYTAPANVSTATYIGNVVILGTCTGCGGGGGGSVNSVTDNGGATLLISPTSGNVLAGINLANPNTWTGQQSGTTPGTSDNTTKFATTAYVKAQGYITAASIPVTSVFGRTGDVAATIGDYAVGQITGAAPLASPSLSGTPTAPTATAGTNTTQIATTAYVLGQGFITISSAPVQSVFGRTGVVVATTADYTVAQVAGAAPLASPALTGTPTTTTAAMADNSSRIASTAYVQNQGFLSGLPAIAADNALVNSSGTTAAPVATPLGSCSGATNALTYNTTTHAFGCNAISGGGSGANPTATIGATAVNGSATTFMRSDGAPALPATLPAISGANLTNLNAGNVSSGTLAVANGGTGNTSLPKMAGTLITTNQTVTDDTWTKINLNSIPIDTASYWDAANHWYKPLVAGNYEACGNVYGSGTAVAQIFAGVVKNGTFGSGGAFVTRSVSVGLATTNQQGVNSGCQIVAMNGTTDTLELDTFIDGTGTLAAIAGNGSTNLSIHLVP